MEKAVKSERRGLFGKNVDMLSGKLPLSIIVYVIPIILSHMLQTMYNAADKIVLSNFSGEAAIAAVGASSPVIGLIVNALIVMATGVNILVSRYIGANDEVNTKSTVTTAFYFSFMISAVVVVMSHFLAEPILLATNCPETIIDKAVTYIRLYGLGIPATMLYNFLMPVLRANGDSKRPLMFLAVSGATNVVLNIILVLVTPLDVEAVAIATVISQYISVALLITRLRKLPGASRLRPRAIDEFSGKLVGKIIRYGLPAAISSAAYSLGNLQIQSAINEFGDYAIAANTAAHDIEAIFLFSITSSLSVTAATFIGRNLGAKKRERVFDVIKWMYIVGFVMVATFGVIICIFAEPILSLYIPDTTSMAMEFAKTSNYIRMGLGFIFSFVQVSVGILNAYGYTTYGMVNSLLFTVGLRVLWIRCIYPMSKTAAMIYFCYPVSWLLTLIGALTMVIMILVRYKRGVEFKL